ncbi:MAG: hypothetical protein JWN02_904, partial [Acidobacteria bacterium]|nr:hypothetical protein [Acidobacteriota bacterium]
MSTQSPDRTFPIATMPDGTPEIFVS